MNYKLSNVCTHEKSLWVQIPPHRRSIAQLGRAPRLGREGRRFESCYSDHMVPSSKGLGHQPFTLKNPDRHRAGSPTAKQSSFEKLCMRSRKPTDPNCPKRCVVTLYELK